VQFGERYIRWLVQLPDGRYVGEDYGHQHLAYEALGWASDANEALALWEKQTMRAGHWFRLDYFPPYWKAGVWQWDDYHVLAETITEQKHLAIARAVSECWLMYQDWLNENA